ncbi:MAG: hypothetical protein HN390_02565 [Anaerolineae bacterium]|jgi:hypothetical protein|nr:hypothetical protein [Anaerolineae bacterium]MBT7188574.1 hypothetical protein [Anaerolineae bacterium]MBT7990540.1 hypothetical protein [Anaerolineae bacterium]
MRERNLSKREQRQVKVNAVLVSACLSDDVRAGKEQVISGKKSNSDGIPVSSENSGQVIVQLMGHNSPSE